MATNKRITLHPTDSEGRVDTSVNLYPKTLKSAIINDDGSEFDVVDEDYVIDAVSGKQDELVSGENIKTVNGENILGEGNINIGSDLSNYYSENNVSITVGGENGPSIYFTKRYPVSGYDMSFVIGTEDFDAPFFFRQDNIEAQWNNNIFEIFSTNTTSTLDYIVKVPEFSTEYNSYEITLPAKSGTLLTNTDVVANSEEEATEDLTKIKVNDTVYNIGGGSSQRKNKPQVKLFPFKFKLVDKPTPKWSDITEQKFKIHISQNKTTIDSDELLEKDLMSNSSFSIALNSGKYGKKAVYLSRQNKYTGIIKPTLQNLKHLRKRYIRHYTNSNFTFKDLINVLMNDDNFVDNHIEYTEDVARLFYTNTGEESSKKHKLSIRLNLKNMSKDVLKNIATNSNLRSRYTFNSTLSRADRKNIFNGTCKLMILNASYYESGDQYIPDTVYYYLNITKVRINEECLYICFTDDINELTNDVEIYSN